MVDKYGVVGDRSQAHVSGRKQQICLPEEISQTYNLLNSVTRIEIIGACM